MLGRGDAGSSSPSAGELNLAVTAPATVPDGEPIQYEIVVSNLSSTGLQDLVLECEFDRSLEFPGSRDQHVRRPLGALSAGASETVTLALTPLSAGQHCVQFRVSGQGTAAVEKDVCVRGEAQPIGLSLSGPDRRNVGQRAEFVLTVENQSGRPLANTRIQIRYDAALAVREASAGMERGEQTLVWDLGTLQRSERVQIQIEVECLAEKEPACLSVRATAADTASSQEACLAIVASDAVLSLTVADDLDPVSAGETVTFRIDVANRGSAELTGWTFELDASDSLEVDSARITMPVGAPDVSIEPSGVMVRLADLPPLAAGATTTIELGGRALREGEASLRIVARSAPEAATVEFTETTLVNPPATDGN
ncbi:MAG: hypothetical protein KDA75_10660 [Planctomycetaceae bacterium]|nr:hypothetical protein [Planctomycetaceae bacterium]